MLELFPEGFEEREGDGELELAAYTNAGGEERVWQVFGPGRAENVPAGWADAWKRFHRPVRIGPLWIGPPWETPEPGALAVVIDPGQAFGTGAHPSTRLCLELLLDRELSSVADLGCGSGILAIAAARLGFAPVYALDLDEAAVAAAAANTAANGVEVEVGRADVQAEELPATELALANIAGPDVARLAVRVPARALIASGYLASERLCPAGWEPVARRESGGWAADLFARA